MHIFNQASRQVLVVVEEEEEAAKQNGKQNTVIPADRNNNAHVKLAHHKRSALHWSMPSEVCELEHSSGIRAGG